jgi:D-3-phosphoglycerate dehydrogenase
MKVLIADKFPDLHIDQMKQMNLEVIYEPKLGENDLPAAAESVDIVVVRSTIVNAATIQNAKALKLIIRAGSGVNNIDILAANAKDVSVANCPGMNSIAVAELAIGLILSLDRRIPDNVADFKNGVWNKAEYSKAEGLFGKTLAIVGVGHIGKEVAKRAHSFGMNVFGRDVVPFESDIISNVSDLKELLSMADVVSLHLPLNASTRGSFNKELFGCMKKGAFLINTSRAEVIDEDAMLEAVKEKNIRVAVDVFVGEPEGKGGSVSSKLQGNPNIYVTHHIGASTEQAQTAVAEETVKIIEGFVKTGQVLHLVNKK